MAAIHLAASGLLPLLLLLLGLVVRAALNSLQLQRKLPPGPPGNLLLGNVFQIPKVRVHLKFTEWAKIYGGIYTLRIGPATAAVITDRTLVKELLDKRSAIYSSRPRSHIGQDLITRGDHLLVMNNNDTWRLFRKTVNQHFKASMCESNHMRVVEAEHTQMMHDFLVHPERHMLHTKRAINSIIMSLLFGIRTPSPDTQHMADLYEIMEKWSQVMETGATPPVDVFPWLKLVPQRWLGSWVDRAMDVGRGMKRLYSSFHHKAIKARRHRHNAQSETRTFLDHVLDLQEKVGLTDNQVDFLGGVMKEGGSDTGSTMLLVMIQALALNPAIQEQAQAELDAVCGTDRSPTWSDFTRLPYINMIVKETMRWRPVTPLAFPHALTKDDWVHVGVGADADADTDAGISFFLPKGTTIFLNVWGLHHDETIHASPDRFDPSRFADAHHTHKLASDSAASPDPSHRDHYIYGAGRRICPGIHLSERSMFVGAAKLLWAFRFEQARDEKGSLVPIDTDPITGYTEGFLVCPKPFRCRVVPRSGTHAETIRREFERAEREVLGGFAVP
ncbi:cytochrome P450 [Aspergillus venezuelensis]